MWMALWISLIAAPCRTVQVREGIESDGWRTLER